MFVHLGAEVPLLELQPLPVHEIECLMLQCASCGEIVLIQRGHEPIIHEQYDHFPGVKFVGQTAACLALSAKCEVLAVRLIIHDKVSDEVRGKEALSDASLAVEEDDKSLGYGCGGVEVSARIKYRWDRRYTGLFRVAARRVP